MRRRLVVAGIAALLVLAGGAGVAAVAAGTSQPVTCSYDGATLVCPVARSTVTVTVQATRTGSTVAAPSAAAAPETILGAAVPVNPSESDTAKVELGVQFKSAVAGQVTGVRFYKGGTSNGGTHVGNLYNSSGSLLRSATFTGETASGWQQVTLPSPVPVTAGAVYTASYVAPVGRYAEDDNYGWPRVSGDLTGVDSVYRYGGGYPTLNWAHANYYVDVTFIPSVVATTTPVTTTAATSTAATTTASSVTTTTASSVTTTATTVTTPTTTAVSTTQTGLQTRNCAPSPHLCGYPDATNTGPAAGTVFLKVPEQATSGPGWTYDPRGWIQVDGVGAVLDGIESTHSVEVYGNNVTIKNSKITITGDGWAVGARHALNLTVDHTVMTSPVQFGAGRMLVAVKDIYGDATVTTTADDISHASTGVQIDVGLIQDTYIHDAGFAAGDHTNGTTSGGGQTGLLKIAHNTIFNQEDQTDAVSLFQDFGIQTNRVIDNNLLAGGGYTIYGGANVGKESTATNIKITNNRISRIYYPNGGSYGYLAAYVSGQGNTFTGNVWDADSSPIPNG